MGVDDMSDKQPSLFSSEIMDSQRVEPEPKPLRLFKSKAGDIIIATDTEDALAIYQDHYADSGAKISELNSDIVRYTINDLGFMLYNDGVADWVDWVEQAVPRDDFIDHFGRGLAVAGSDD